MTHGRCTSWHIAYGIGDDEDDDDDDDMMIVMLITMLMLIMHADGGGGGGGVEAEDEDEEGAPSVCNTVLFLFSAPQCSSALHSAAQRRSAQRSAKRRDPCASSFSSSSFVWGGCSGLCLKRPFRPP